MVFHRERPTGTGWWGDKDPARIPNQMPHGDAQGDHRKLSKGSKARLKVYSKRHVNVKYMLTHYGCQETVSATVSVSNKMLQI